MGKGIFSKSWVFIKHLYWLIPALFTDPFDFLERWFGVTFELPKYVFPTLLVVGLGLAIWLTYRELKQKESVKEKRNGIGRGVELYKVICNFLERDRWLAEETVKRLPEQEIIEFRKRTKETDIGVFLKDKEGFPPMLGELRQNDETYLKLRETAYRLNKEFGDKKLSNDILRWIRMELVRNNELAWGAYFEDYSGSAGAFISEFLNMADSRIEEQRIKVKLRIDHLER